MNNNSNTSPFESYNFTYSFNASDWNTGLPLTPALSTQGIQSKTQNNTDVHKPTAEIKEVDTTSSNYTTALSMARDYHALGLARNDAITLISAYLPPNHRVDIPAVVHETYTKEIIFPELYQGTMADYVLSKLNGCLHKIEKEDVFWHWNGQRWDTSLHSELVKPMILNILRTQPGVYDKAVGHTYRKWVNTIYNIKGTTELVLSQCPKVKRSQINTNPQLINLQNGVFSFADMTLRKAEAKEFLIHTAPFTYDATATCPEWEHFIHTITLGKQDLYDYIQMMTGYLLQGENILRLIFFFLGNGLNGKGTYVKVMEALMGEDYCSPMKDSTAKIKKYEGRNDDLIPLIHKRAYFLAEMKRDDIVDTSLLKGMSSGDSQMGRANYQDYRKLNLQGSLVVQTNELPKVMDTSHAYYDRLNIVPFDYRVPDKQEDPKLKYKLVAEIPGIFNWAMAGMRMAGEKWINFRETAEMIALKNEYRRENDLVYSFLEHCYDQSVTHKTPTREVYADYNLFMKRMFPSTHTEVNGYTLKSKFTAKGIRYINSNGTWFNLKRKPEWEEQRQQLASVN